MKDKKINQIRAGVILSYINLGISCVIPLLYTPVMLRILGQSEYGLYSLANSVISYLSLLTFGFGSTIIRYISKYRAENNKEGVERTFGLFLILYSIAAVAVIIVGTVVSFNVEPIFNRGLDNAEIAKVSKLIMIMTVSTAISFPVSVFSSIITSYERYIYRKLVDMLSTVAAPIANLIALYLGYGSVGMSVAAMIVQLIMLPLNVVYCSRVLNLHPRFQRIESSLLKEIFRFSFYVFVGTIVDLLFWSTDKVILGMLASSTAVAIYNVGGTFNNMVINLSSSISGVLTPRITGMVVNNASKDEITELFIRVGRIQYIIIALIVSGFTVFGQEFILLWAGSEYIESYWIAILTLFPLCIPLIQNTGIGILTAKNKHKFRSIVYLVIAIANVVSTYLVVPYLGGIGAALCSCISYLLGQGLIMNLYYYKVIGINIPLFWKNIGKMSFVPALMLIGSLILKQSIVHINGWFQFLLSVVCYTIIYLIAMYLLAFNDYERGILNKPIKKILGRFHR